jgi:hypothetical protein
MNKNPILPARMFFFSTSSLPQNFPTSYLPPTTPSPPHSITRALELSSESEPGAGAVARAGMCLELELLEPGPVVGAGVGPMRDPGKHLFFFLLCLFCLLFFALQEKTSFLSLVLLRYATVLPSPSSSSFGAAV